MNKKTTDNQGELFDLVNEHDQVIGKATRGECHTNKALIHRAVILIVHNNKGQVFLQQRSATKDMFPLLWTFSATGHVTCSDNYIDTAVREAKEELGIDISKKELEFVTTVLVKSDQETEINAVFMLYHKGPFSLLAEEIKQGMWVDVPDLGTVSGTPCFFAAQRNPLVAAKLNDL